MLRKIIWKVLALSNDTSVALGRVSAAYVSLQENVSNCAGSAIISPLLDEAIDLESFSEGLQSELDALSADSLSGLADDVSGSHWSVVSASRGRWDV